MFKYQQIASKIRADIINGKYNESGRLPNEATLSSLYNCSRMTIKQATDHLVIEGLITKKKGAGMYIRPRLSNKNSSLYSNKPNVFGFNNSFKDLNTITRIKTFEVIKGDDSITEKLNLKSGSFLYHVERVRIIDDEPIIFENLYFPIDVIVGLTEEIICNSIYNYIENELNIKIYNADKFIRAVLPSKEVQGILEISEYDPVIEMQHVVYSSNGEPLEYANLCYKGSKYQMHFITQNYE
ncbi:GntR family transcriptional regulator [Clostridium sp. MB05]